MASKEEIHNIIENKINEIISDDSNNSSPADIYDGLIDGYIKTYKIKTLKEAYQFCENELLDEFLENTYFDEQMKKDD